MLRMFGLHTPAPCLLLEMRAGPLRRHAYFLSEKAAGHEALQWLRDEPLSGARWQAALPGFRELFHVMREYQIIHGDMKATNFLVSRESEQQFEQQSEQRFDPQSGHQFDPQSGEQFGKPSDKPSVKHFGK